ncbi:MAG: response regulator transcription factor [Gaiellales bacterium]
MTARPSPAASRTSPGASTVPEPAVLLVDDHDLFRAGLRQLLEGQGVRVVGDARCDPAAIDMGRRTRSTIAIFDTHMTEGESTHHLIKEFATALPDVGLVMFTRSTEPIDIYCAIRAGARGYVSKSAPIEHLATAIRTVHTGGAWMHPTLITTVLEFIRTGVVPTTHTTDMSERELEVLRLIAEGLDNNEIAANLEISAKTVKNHVSSILAKLKITNRVQAAAYAIRSGIA